MNTENTYKKENMKKNDSRHNVLEDLIAGQEKD